MVKKKENTLNIDNILFNCRNYLRAAKNSGSFFEKRDMMLWNAPLKVDINKKEVMVVI